MVAGYRVHWTWRCESCGLQNYIFNLELLEENIRLLMQVEQHTIRFEGAPIYRELIAKCESCNERAHWEHIASEIQVNRALKAPYDFFGWDAFDLFRQLQTRDTDHNLRLFDPA